MKPGPISKSLEMGLDLPLSNTSQLPEHLDLIGWVGGGQDGSDCKEFAKIENARWKKEPGNGLIKVSFLVNLVNFNVLKSQLDQ